MATVGRLNNACTPNTSRRSYISTAEFDEHFQSYTVSIVDRETIGTLGPVVGASCSKCPAGRILRETGRKLYPDANVGVDRYLVGVYDSVSFLNGFIDPNANVFAVYNSDKPTYIPNNSDSSAILGAPVATSGDIISTEGFVGVYSTIKNKESYAGAYLWGNRPVVEAATVRPDNCDDITFYQSTTHATLYPNGTIESINEDHNTYVRLTANGNIVNTGNTTTSSIVTAAKFNVSPLGSGRGSSGSPLNASAGSATFDGSSPTIIYTTQCTAASLVFITINNIYPTFDSGGGDDVARSATVVPGAGSFTVYSTKGDDTSTFFWLIIN